MRILRAIVQTLMLAVFDLKAHLRPCSAVRTKLVRDHDPRRCAGGFEELPHEPLRSGGVSSTLDQDVEHETILIDRAPKPVLLAGDRDDDLIHMPCVAASRRALADLIGARLAELLPPTGARSRRSRKSRAPTAFPRPCEGSRETGNRAKPHSL